jgi:hypothetical protein
MPVGARTLLNAWHRGKDEFMNSIPRLLAATVFGAGMSLMLGCEPNMSGTAGGYHSTSSEQNVGSRSSHGLAGGTVDQTGSAGGGTYGQYSPTTPATPYSSSGTPANGTTPYGNPPAGTTNTNTGNTTGGTTPYNGGVTLPPPPVPSGGTSETPSNANNGASGSPQGR